MKILNCDFLSKPDVRILQRSEKKENNRKRKRRKKLKFSKGTKKQDEKINNSGELMLKVKFKMKS